MNELFADRYIVLWMLALGVALFVPVRQLIWVLTMRRAERRNGAPLDEAESQRLRRRAGATSLLLCFVFSVVYVAHLFGSGR